MLKKTLIGLCLFAAWSGSAAQTEENPQVTDSLLTQEPTDSARLVETLAELEAAQVREKELRMEMEELRMATIISDSLAKVAQKRRVDSLRMITKGVPVIVEDDTLFIIYARQGGLLPQARAKNAEKAILELGKTLGLKPDSLYIESTDIRTDLMFGDKLITSFTDQDGLWANCSRDELAALHRPVVVEKLKALQREYGLMRILTRILYLIILFAVQGGLIWGTLRLYRRLKQRIERLLDTKLKPITFHDYEFLDTRKQVTVLMFGASLLRYLVIAIQLFISIPILFSIFPQTKGLAYKIFSYIWNPVREIAGDVVAYTPKLFTIIVIWLAVRYLVKGVKYLAGEIEAEKLKLSGFYPDWAQPSFQIIRFLLYAFMIAMIYPYLPNSDSGIFQGVSVFVGLIVSLGSSNVIGNIIAGMVITYMRPFKIGDRIKLNDTVGNVIEKTPFVTRIRTPKNEIVTIPNSFVMSSHTINYSSSARNYGLILHTEVEYGYDVPWELAHACLMEAAKRTDEVLQDPPPFVLQTALAELSPVYQINVYIKDANKIPRIFSDLHRNIQDTASESGIEIATVRLISTRSEPTPAVPRRPWPFNPPWKA
ncbi:MAG: mechanosensitive ion channel family protein [Tannerellaceae bacterium]|jgi:small-conductance mechanosensitive channel|nr:mechanosensitive ion channel family protein [Tannerellaceae bacterium]